VHDDGVLKTELKSSKGPPEIRRESPLVAVVDDDASFRKALARLVGLWGYRTATFASAEEYLRGSVSTDCLLLDLHLEGMNGLELQSRLIEGGSVVPIIFVTAMDDPVSERRALDAGAVAYLEKPFDEHRLVDVLRAVTGYQPG
jgi:FixJ family two-component response regulator